MKTERRLIAMDTAINGDIGIIFPDLRGCTAMGSTLAEALENAVSAYRDWCRVTPGRTMPEPISLDAARAEFSDTSSILVYLEIPVENSATRVKPGFYWAKMTASDPGTRDGEEMISGEWEVVQVVENSIDKSDPEYLMVSVPGIERSQSIGNFEFGPRVDLPERLSK